MASSLTESRIDHRGEPLPDGVYALIERTGEVVSYKARWRERDANGIQRQRSKSFSRRDAGSLGRARAAAIAHRDGALQIVRAGDAVLRPDRAAGIVLGDLFKEWITHHAAPNTGERYARDAVRTTRRIVAQVPATRVVVLVAVQGECEATTAPAAPPLKSPDGGGMSPRKADHEARPHDARSACVVSPVPHSSQAQLARPHEARSAPAACDQDARPQDARV